MSKIKEIQSRLTKNPEEYRVLRFVIAKQVFIINVTLYFFAYLFTVGGFYFGPLTIDSLAIIRYHLYSLLIISTAFFGFSLAEFLLNKNGNTNKIGLIIVGILCVLFSAFALIAHL